MAGSPGPAQPRPRNAFPIPGQPEAGVRSCEFFKCAWYTSEPGTLMKHESLSARAGIVKDVDNGNGPPDGGPARVTGRRAPGVQVDGT